MAGKTIKWEKSAPHSQPLRGGCISKGFSEDHLQFVAACTRFSLPESEISWHSLALGLVASQRVATTRKGRLCPLLDIVPTATLPPTVAAAKATGADATDGLFGT